MKEKKMSKIDFTFKILMLGSESTLFFTKMLGDR